MNQKQRKEKEAARRERRAKAAHADRAAKKQANKMQDARELALDLAKHSGRKFYTIADHPHERATGTNLQPPQPNPIETERANPRNFRLQPVQITRPFGVILMAQVQSDGEIYFSLNAELDEREGIACPACASAEDGIRSAIEAAEEVSRRRAAKLLESQGFTKVDLESTEARKR